MKRLILLCMALMLASPVLAQHELLSTRSQVALPQTLGMGDAVVALPMQQSAFFYNPAHAAHAKLHVTIAGLQLSASSTVLDQLSYYKDDLQPALDEGIENLDSERLKSLYDRTLEVGRQTTFLNLNVLAPSAGFHIGPVGVGVGIFGSSTFAYRFPDGGGGLPLVQITGVADAMVVGSAGMSLSRFGVSGLSAGITAKYTRRYASLKSKPLDALSDNEPFDLLVANRTSVDLGFLYELPLLNKIPGKMHVGLAVYDIVGSNFDFAHESTIQGTSSPEAILQDIASANTFFEVQPSFRLGVGYTLPKLPLKLIDESGVMLDYVGSQSPHFDQAFFSHLRIGAQVKAKMVSLRAGLNQGYPTIGAGVSLGFMDLDYAYYGMEQGRYPGQLPSWHHAAQLRFGF